MNKYDKIKNELSKQLDKCMNERSDVGRRYERAVLMGMLQAFRLTDDISPGLEDYYLEKMLDMIDEEREV